MKFLLPLFLFLSLSLYGHPSSGTHQELTIIENMYGGKVLKLSNGTSWEVAPQDVQITGVWIFPFPLKLEDSNNPAYPYYLINVQANTKVLVRPFLK